MGTPARQSQEAVAGRQLYKQTQFPVAAEPRRRPIVQNEANASIADCGFRIGHRPVAGRRIVRNKPNSASGKEEASALRERIYGE